MFEIISSIEVDIALVSGIISLLIAGGITTVGLVKTANETRTRVRLGISEGEKFINIGSKITLVALFPLTIYVTTRVFPTLFQQFIVCFLILGLFTYAKKSRYLVQFPVAIVMSFAVSLLSIVLNILYAIVKKLGVLLGVCNKSNDTEEDTDSAEM